MKRPCFLSLLGENDSVGTSPLPVIRGDACKWMLTKKHEEEKWLNVISPLLSPLSANWYIKYIFQSFCLIYLMSFCYPSQECVPFSSIVMQRRFEVVCAGCSWPGVFSLTCICDFSLNIKSLRINRMEISLSAFLIFVAFIKIEALCSPNLQQSK